MFTRSSNTDLYSITQKQHRAMVEQTHLQAFFVPLDILDTSV